MNILLRKFQRTLDYIQVLEKGVNHHKQRNAKLTNGLTDLKSQLIDGGHKLDSVTITSINTLLKK